MSNDGVAGSWKKTLMMISNSPQPFSSRRKGGDATAELIPKSFVLMGEEMENDSVGTSDAVWEARVQMESDFADQTREVVVVGASDVTNPFVGGSFSEFFPFVFFLSTSKKHKDNGLGEWKPSSNN